MAFFGNLSIGRKLAVLIATGLLGSGTAGAIGLWTQERMEVDAEQMRVLESVKAALNHLDARVSELKVGAYRAAIEPDVAAVVAEVAEDRLSVERAVTAVEAVGLPPDLRNEFDAVKPFLTDFIEFVVTFAADAQVSQASLAAREPEIAERDRAFDVELKVVHDSLDGKLVEARVEVVERGEAGNVWTAVVLAVGLALFVAVAVPVSRSVVRPVRRVQRVLEALATGDLTARVGPAARDEVGRMAVSLDTAMESIQRSVQAVSASADGLADASRQLSAVSGDISSAVSSATAQMNEASYSTTEVSQHVGTVAAGAEEMGASIHEIARSAGEAAQVASDAVREAAAANQKVEQLAASSTEIGKVLKLITTIAGQTNLLALNATIEAARAGQAGKGFAVVASEVKDLARETAKATDDIRQRITAIQTDTVAAAEAIRRMSTVIEDINHYQATIASAVEEQSATTQEMSRSVGEVASGADRIAGNIAGVAAAADATTAGVAAADNASGELARMSDDLRALVSVFRY